MNRVFLTCLAVFLIGFGGIYGIRDYLVSFVQERVKQETARQASTTMQKFQDERMKIGEDAVKLEVIRRNLAERTKTWATMTPEERKALKNNATAYNQRNATLKARALELDGLEAQARMLEEIKAQMEIERKHRRAESELVMYSLTTYGTCTDTGAAKKQELRASGIAFREVLLDKDSAGSQEFANLLRENNISGGCIRLPSFAYDGKVLVNNPSINEIRNLMK